MIQSQEEKQCIIPPQVATSFQQLIGNTPMIEIKRIFSHPKIKILAKLEGNNPCGSIKDRPAFNMMNEAFKRGDIKPGMKLVEITSGNTGIALAMVANIFGVSLDLIMPDSYSIERIKTMEAFGAKVTLTPALEGFTAMRLLADKMLKTGEYYQLNQFANPDNYLAHYKTTGPEIYRDTLGKITHFVAGIGTSGTVMGVSRYMKEQNPEIKIVGVQPVLDQAIPGTARWIPQMYPKIFEPDRLDGLIDVSAQDAIEMTRRLAKEECIFAGNSSGASLVAAIEVAKKLEEGVIVIIICDRGDRYLSTSLFGK